MHVVIYKMLLGESHQSIYKWVGFQKKNGKRRKTLENLFSYIQQCVYI